MALLCQALFMPVMAGGSKQQARVKIFQARQIVQHCVGQVGPVCPNLVRKPDILCDQKFQVAAPCVGQDGARNPLINPVLAAQNDAAAPWQARHDGARISQTVIIGQ